MFNVALVPVVAWCHQETSHYQIQCWMRSMSPYGVSRPQRGNINFESVCECKNIQSRGLNNVPNSQIPECTCSISQNAPFRTEMCTFLFWMEHSGIWNRCILGFVKLVILSHGSMMSVYRVNIVISHLDNTFIPRCTSPSNVSYGVSIMSILDIISDFIQLLNYAKLYDYHLPIYKWWNAVSFWCTFIDDCA